MKRTLTEVFATENTSLDKKVKIFKEIEEALRNGFLNSTECRSTLSFTGYLECCTYFLNHRNSDKFKNFNVDILLNIHSYLNVNDALGMMYVCKSWYDSFFNSDYFWKQLGELFYLPTTFYETSEIRDFIILKNIYYQTYSKKPKHFSFTSLQNSDVDSVNEGDFKFELIDDIYFEGSVDHTNVWYGCGGGDTKLKWDIDISGVYFEITTLQHFFFDLTVNLDYDSGGDTYYNTFKLSISKNNNENCKNLVKMNSNRFFEFDLELLKELIRDWLLLVDEEVEDEITWLHNFLSDRLSETQDFQLKELLKRFNFPSSKRKLKEHKMMECKLMEKTLDKSMVKKDKEGEKKNDKKR
ncbi:hypothetical protein ABK040_016080 [Willaertia magna]